MKGELPLKILQVCPRYYPFVGGIETHVQQLSKGLTNKGFEVTVLTVDPSKRLKAQETVDGLTIIRVPGYARNEEYLFSPALVKAIRKSDYDVIHAHSYHAFPALFARYSFDKNKKFVFTPHFIGFPTTAFKKAIHAIYKPLGSGVFKSADKVVCVSYSELNFFKDFFGVSTSKMKYIPLAIDTKKICYSFSPPAKGECFNICCVGRLSREKNIPLLLRSFRMVRNTHKSTRLFIIGSGPEEKALKLLTNKLGLNGSVTFTGRMSQKEVIDFLKKMHILVHPAKFTGTGKSPRDGGFSAGGPLDAIEAIATGVPVIMTRVGDIPRYLKNNESCLFIHHENHKKLAKIIRKLIDEPERAKMISQNARKIAEEHWDYDKIIGQYQRMYHELGGER